ncbi:hypothetical protein BCEN4_660051 [Burkholderia cenocepacia]|nr:hypothetical protein BCEN4_660051 [Burkholderia cenocepacia]
MRSVVGRCGRRCASLRVRLVTGGLSARWANAKLRQNRERTTSERTARDDTELRALPDAGISAVFRDGDRGFSAGRGRQSVVHARRR